MAAINEIQNVVRSTKKTQKITQAMQRVATGRLHKCQSRMQAGRFYADAVQRLSQDIAMSSSEYQHCYLVERPIARVGYILISTDRGLCGGLNANLFKAMNNHIKDQGQRRDAIEYCAIGQKGAAFIQRTQGQLMARSAHLGDQPQVGDVVAVVQSMMKAYEQGKVDRVYVCYNRFVSTMAQKPIIMPLLPLTRSGKVEGTAPSHHWDYLYEPEAKDVLDVVLGRYIESLVYQAVVENIACEQAARMIAMKNATENADGIIDSLQLAYNKARQAAITQEISEIVAGSNAV